MGVYQDRKYDATDRKCESENPSSAQALAPVLLLRETVLVLASVVGSFHGMVSGVRWLDWGTTCLDGFGRVDRLVECSHDAS